MTKVVVRRDLAVARSKSGTEATTKPAGAPAVTTAGSGVPDRSAAQPSDFKLDKVDVEKPKTPQLESAKVPEGVSTTSPKKRPSPSHEDGSIDEHPTKKQAGGDKTPVASGPQTSDTKLELNTKPSGVKNEQAAEDKAPDTATFSNTGDLDSLFNDPSSAGGMGGDSGGEADFSTSADINAEFDFQSFNDTGATNANDRMSALLPGLQDYANDTASGEPDFTSFFNPDPSTNLAAQPQTPNTATGQQQIDTAQGDSTFEDLFDLTFDMSGGNDGNQSGGNDFNFNFD
jgi:hypothetical protein